MFLRGRSVKGSATINIWNCIKHSFMKAASCLPFNSRSVVLKRACFYAFAHSTASPSHSCEQNISRTPSGEFVWYNVQFDSRMNLLYSICQRSRSLCPPTSHILPCESNSSKTPFKFGIKVHLDSKMNSLNFGGETSCLPNVLVKLYICITQREFH